MTRSTAYYLTSATALASFAGVNLFLFHDTAPALAYGFATFSAILVFTIAREWRRGLRKKDR